MASRDFNQILIIGNVGHTPKTGDGSKNGTMWASFSVATNRSYKDGAGEWQQITQWHNVKTFNKALIENIIVPHLSKGSKVLVCGEMTYRKYTNKDGEEQNVAEIIIPPFTGILQIMEKSEGGSNQQAAVPTQPAAAPTQQAVGDIDFDDDIPF